MKEVKRLVKATRWYAKVIFTLPGMSLRLAGFTLKLAITAIYGLFTLPIIIAEKLDKE